MSFSSSDKTVGNLESLRSVYKLLKAYHGNGSAAVRNIIDHYSIDRRLATIKDWLQTTSTGASMQNGPESNLTTPGKRGSAWNDEQEPTQDRYAVEQAIMQHAGK
jgi:hypothetical protein